MRFFRASAEHGTQSLPIVYTIGSDGRVWLQAVLVLAPSSSGGFSDLLTSATLAFVSLQTARSRLWRGQHCTLGTMASVRLASVYHMPGFGAAENGPQKVAEKN